MPVAVIYSVANLNSATYSTTAALMQATTEADSGLLDHRAEPREAEAQSAEFLRDDDPGPAERGHLRPQLARVAERVARVAQRAQRGDRGVGAEEFPGRFAQQALLIGVAQLFFGVDYLRGPAALLVMMVSLSLVASTLGLLLAALLKSEQALVATTVLVSMAVAALSGAWFPLEITGEAFRSVGHVLPTAWILDGLRGIVVRGFGVADVLPAFWVSLAWATGFFVVAVWRFRLSE